MENLNESVFDKRYKEDKGDECYQYPYTTFIIFSMKLKVLSIGIHQGNYKSYHE